jgi:hypothetical protein
VAFVGAPDNSPAALPPTAARETISSTFRSRVSRFTSPLADHTDDTSANGPDKPLVVRVASQYGARFHQKRMPDMKNLKNDPALAEMPPPVTLSLEQLSAVAAETSDALGGGLLLSSLIIAGGIRWQPVNVGAIAQVSATQIAI